MPKLHIARSEFYDPILNLPEGVHLLAPYAIRPLVGCLEDRITANSIPRLWDGERWLTLVDHREGPYGFGGKYELKRVQIAEGAMEDREMLEDLMVVAYADAFKQVEAASEKLMSGATAGMPMPPGFKLPF